MRIDRIDHYLNTLNDCFLKGGPGSPSRPLTKWLSAVILTMTIYFGAAPFNFISRNDLEFHPETGGLSFNTTSLEGESSQRGIVYTLDSLPLAPNQPISMLLQLTPTRTLNGLETFVELHDGKEQPPLIIANGSHT